MNTRTRFTVHYSDKVAKFSEYRDALIFGRTVRHCEISDKTGLIAQFMDGKLTPEFEHVSLPTELEHVWHEFTINSGARYARLVGVDKALVRITPQPNQTYLWQFRNKSGTSRSVQDAKEHVEAGVEFFEVMHRNPYE